VTNAVLQIIRMSKVVFELETTTPVTWSPSDDDDVFDRQNVDQQNADKLRGGSSNSSSNSRTLLLKGEMKYVESLSVVIFLCKPL